MISLFTESEVPIFLLISIDKLPPVYSLTVIQFYTTFVYNFFMSLNIFHTFNYLKTMKLRHDYTSY